jgi:hypothetical protein
VAKQHEPITVALIRDIGQRGYYGEVINPSIRSDGWLHDNTNNRWYSPDNVLSITTFTPRTWDGNGLKPGMLCQYNAWLGVTSERPTGMEKISVMLTRKLKTKWWVLINGSERLLPERSLEPLMDQVTDSHSSS